MLLLYFSKGFQYFMVNPYNRADNGQCLCCGLEIGSQNSLTSLFLSRRAWGGDVEPSMTHRCKSCDFAFHGRGLTEEEVGHYYKNYRDENYFIQRHACEPFYTRKVHEGIEGQLGGQDRRDALSAYLKANLSPSLLENSSHILDYAGGTGRLISDLPGRKFVFDVSGESPAPGVELIDEMQLKSLSFDIVICAQMLEHATDPAGTVQQLLSLVKPGGALYIEVPYDETWRDFSCSGKIRDVLLSWAQRSRLFNLALDIYGTAFRVKFKILPPFAFVPVREHLNYFSPKSLEALALSLKTEVINVGRVPLLGTVIAIKKPL